MFDTILLILDIVSVILSAVIVVLLGKLLFGFMKKK